MKKWKKYFKKTVAIIASAALIVTSGQFLPNNYTYSKAEDVPEQNEGTFIFSDDGNNYKTEFKAINNAVGVSIYITKVEQLSKDGDVLTETSDELVLPKNIKIPSTVTLDVGNSYTVTGVGGGTKNTTLLSESAYARGNLGILSGKYKGDNFGKIILPNTCKDIYNYAFSRESVSYFKTIEANNVQSIGKNAFEDSSLTYFVVPDSCKEIEENAFTNAQDMNLFIMNPNVEFFDAANTFSCKSYVGYKHSTLADLVSSDLVSFDNYSGDLPDDFSKPADTSFKVNVSLENSELITSNDTTITPEFRAEKVLYSYSYLTDNILSAKNVKMHYAFNPIYKCKITGLYNKAGVQLFDVDGNLLTNNKSDFDFSDDNNSEAIVYAKFKLCEYCLSYYNCVNVNENGEDEMVVSGLNAVKDNKYNSYDVMYTYGDKIILPIENESFHRVGYTFDGWTKEDNENGERLTELNLMELGYGENIYAHWKVNTYKITFDYNGGEKINNTDNVTSTHTYGTDSIKIADAKRNGYTFMGWLDKNTNKIVTEIPKYQASNVVYEAQWKADTPITTPVPTAEPTKEPVSTVKPTIEPTIEPTKTPDVSPTATNNGGSTGDNNGTPTPNPTVKPTKTPTSDDMNGEIITKPTVVPTEQPTIAPTSEPNVEPSTEPTVEPTKAPVKKPSKKVKKKKLTWKKVKGAKRYVIYIKKGKKWKKIKTLKVNKLSVKIKKNEKYRIIAQKKVTKKVKNKKKTTFKKIKVISKAVKFK